ncbi:hypothetical protein K9M16_05155 [Candidatus Babeliales bacterium]|nr:hypothetical protein [Candidatus Babeliales bacterium]MCF7910116.1 hypothetical protein [Candidatus Pacearchaeota archaeon]
MLNKTEIGTIILITIILAFVTTLIQTWSGFFYALLSIFLILIINIIAKKIMAFYLDSEIEIKLWEIKRYGFKPSRYFKKPFPAGVFFPFITKIIFFPLNSFVWMASITFDVKPKVYRAARRHGLYTFSEMTEYHLALIASAGIVANLLFAILGYLINLPTEMRFAQLSVIFAFWNMLPYSDLDGNKIFFGSIVLWVFLASLILISLLAIIIII